MDLSHRLAKLENQIPHLRITVYAIALGVAGYIAFGNLPSHSFTYEDLDYIRNAGQAQDNWLLIFSPDKAWAGRPTVDLVFYFAYKVFG